MSIAEFCVKRPVFTTMLVALFVVTGVFSFRDLSVDLLPKADPAVIQVMINLPGASPDMTPDDIARTALFLAAEAPVALTGACLDIFG